MDDLELARLQGQLAAHRLLLALWIVGIARHAGGDSAEHAVDAMFAELKARAGAADHDRREPAERERVAEAVAEALHAEIHLMQQSVRDVLAW